MRCTAFEGLCPRGLFFSAPVLIALYIEINEVGNQGLKDRTKMGKHLLRYLPIHRKVMVGTLGNVLLNMSKLLLSIIPKNGLITLILLP